ncbi:MAG: hypothetical protein LBS56_09410 [Propionibacteriaceae bacterium]|nr:hypothetical protein [Propionibacteriaceae bacterium]
MLADAPLMAVVQRSVGVGGFHFAPPQREVARFERVGLHPGLHAYEAAYQAIFYTSPHFSPLLGRCPAAVFVRDVLAVQRLCVGSPLRGALPWRPPDRRGRQPMNYFFLTTHRGAASALWRLACSPLALGDAVPGLEAGAFYQCEQDVPHVHGLLRMGIPSTMLHMVRLFAGVPGVSVEALRHRPAAALAYMRNQASGPPAVYPHGGVLEMFRTAAAPLEEAEAGARILSVGAHINACLQSGVPWYVLKYRLPFQPKAARRRYRRASRNRMLLRQMPWDIIPEDVAADGLPAALDEACDRHGLGACRLLTAATFWRWAGEPVLVTYEDPEELWNIVGRDRLPVINIIHVAEAG